MTSDANPNEIGYPYNHEPRYTYDSRNRLVNVIANDDTEIRGRLTLSLIKFLEFMFRSRGILSSWLAWQDWLFRRARTTLRIAAKFARVCFTRTLIGPSAATDNSKTAPTAPSLTAKKRGRKSKSPTEPEAHVYDLFEAQ